MNLFHHPPIWSKRVPFDGFPLIFEPVPPERILTDAPGMFPRWGESIISLVVGGQDAGLDIAGGLPLDYR